MRLLNNYELEENMYNNYKIVVNTAAGRRRYMQYLVPFIVADNIVDRYDIWVNTHNGADIEFFKRIARQYPKVNLVMQPDGIVAGNTTINAFYKECCEEDTIYFKLDDDICWMEPDAIKKMVKFRVDNPQYFIVSPLVINNPICTYMLEATEKIRLSKYQVVAPFSKTFWRSGEFAYLLHDWFINHYIVSEDVNNIHIGKHEWGANRLSINAILWFGKDLKIINGIVPGDDEDFLSALYPTKIGRCNCVNGDAVVSHFAFFPQREFLDKQHILERYGEILHNQWQTDPNMKKIDDTIRLIMADIAASEKDLMSRPSPYKRYGMGISKPSMADRASKQIKSFWKNISKPFKKKNKIKIL